MHELTTAANLVDYETFESGGAIAATLSRAELETALTAEGTAEIWLEFAQESHDDARLTLELSDADIEAILRSSEGDAVVLAFDGDTLAGLLDDPEVESHGLRGALAIAVTTAAIVAPTSVAASPQNADAAATVQRAHAATSVQQVDAAATAQVSQRAVKAQVTSVAAKTQVNRSFRLKASGVKVLRSSVR